VVELALAYVERNRERMDLSALRRMGLPVSSSLVGIADQAESTSGLKAASSSGPCGLRRGAAGSRRVPDEDDRAEAFHRRRPRGPAVGCNRRRFRESAK